MPLNLLNVLTSPPICCILGPDEETFYVQDALIRHFSPSLSNAVNKALTDWNMAIMPDVDADAFKQAVEFMLTGSYTECSPTQEPFTPATDDEETQSENSNDEIRESGAAETIADGEASHSLSPPTPAQKQHAEGTPSDQPPQPEGLINAYRHSSPARAEPLALDQFAAIERRLASVTQSLRVYASPRDRLWGTFVDRAEVEDRSPWLPRRNEHAREDYTPVFLSHARVYKFARTCGMKPLQELALQRLRLTLVHYTLYDERIDDIHALLAFAAETGEVNCGSGRTDRLLQMVVDYTVCHGKCRVYFDGFKEIVDAYPWLKEVRLRLPESSGA